MIPTEMKLVFKKIKEKFHVNYPPNNPTTSKVLKLQLGNKGSNASMAFDPNYIVSYNRIIFSL